MKTGTLSVNAFCVTDHANLDRITVYYHDFEPGKGQITIVCYGEAWTAYWGAMGNRDVLKFFVECDLCYLVGRLMGAQFQKHTKGHEMYLTRIVSAIRTELQAREVLPCAS
jgi:hypothetical protein